MVSNPLKNISQLGILFPIYEENTSHVPNHQPVFVQSPKRSCAELAASMHIWGTFYDDSFCSYFIIPWMVANSEYHQLIRLTYRMIRRLSRIKHHPFGGVGFRNQPRCIPPTVGFHKKHTAPRTGISTEKQNITEPGTLWLCQHSYGKWP